MSEAEDILYLCEHFHVLPSALMKENASLLRLMAVRAGGASQSAMTPVFEGDDD